MRSSPGRRRLRWACLAVIVLLYGVSVPWYRESNEPLILWLGLPDWVAVAVLCYVGVAIFNAIAWVLTEVPDELGGAGDYGVGVTDALQVTDVSRVTDASHLTKAPSATYRSERGSGSGSEAPR